MGRPCSLTSRVQYASGEHENPAVLAGLTTELVYHMGRHSFASLVTLEEGVPIETISKMLGHNNKDDPDLCPSHPEKLFEDMGPLH